MPSVQETIEAFSAAFEDAAVDALFVQPDGAVFLENSQRQRTAVESLDLETLYAVIAEIRQQIQVDDRVPLLAFEWNALRWTLVQPPLSHGVAMVIERLKRPRSSMQDLVGESWLSMEDAEKLHAAVVRRDNILISSPFLREGHRLLEALAILLPEGGLNFFVGDLERFEPPPAHVSTMDRVLLRDLPMMQRRVIGSLIQRAQHVLIDQVGDVDDLFWSFGGDLFARGRVVTLEAASAAEALNNLQMLASLGAPRQLAGLVQWTLHIDTTASGGCAVRMEAVGQVTQPEPLKLLDPPPAPVFTAPPRASLEEEPFEEMASPEPTAQPEASAPSPSADPDPEEEEIDSRLSDAVSSAFADFESSVFSLDIEDEDDGEVSTQGLEALAEVAGGSGLGEVEVVDEMPKEEEAEEEEEGGGGFNLGLMFEPGELDDEEEEQEKGKTLSRHSRAVSGSRAAPSRYNADKVRQDAESIRNQRGRYRPPSAARPGRPGSKPPTPITSGRRPPSGESGSPRWSGDSDRGRGASAFRKERSGRWRQPTDARPPGSSPPSGLKRPPSSPQVRRVSPPKLSRSGGSDELPMLASGDIEAIQEPPTTSAPPLRRSEEPTSDVEAVEVEIGASSRKRTDNSTLSSLARGLAEVLDKRKSSDSNPKLEEGGADPESGIGDDVEISPLEELEE